MTELSARTADGASDRFLASGRVFSGACAEVYSDHVR